MFWVDEIVEDIITKIEKNDYLITDWMTPSGHAHIGSLRGLIIHDLIRSGLSKKGKKAIFQFGFDDFDPMDGRPIYVDKSWDQYMGIPFYQIPAPDGKSKSYADEYINEAIEVTKGLGLEIKFVRAAELYKEGKYDKPIEIVLNNANRIRQIYKEISGSDKGEDWFPLQVVCPNCGKLGTTKVTGWNGKTVTFECVSDLVEWAKGCGYKGEISPFGGKAKIPWKVEWACRWFVFSTDIEGEGKDHFAAGGSRDVADSIYRKIFEKEPPYDVRYEHILVGGKKMSKSKGTGVTAKDIYDFLPANILRFLFTRTRFKRAIDFQPDGESIPLLYDEYDRGLQSYLQDPLVDLSRAFYYSQKEGTDNVPNYLLRFSKIAYMLQMPRVDILDYAVKEKGSDLTDVEKKEIESRIKIATEWLKNYAPDNYKFTVKEEMPKVDLTNEQKEFLAKIKEKIESKESWTGEDLHKEIHNIKNEMGISPRDAFSSIYFIFIGKDSGPQAGWLLASLNREFVLKRLEEAIR